ASEPTEVVFSQLVCCAGGCVAGEEASNKPNFVLMMVDDLGIGDVGCYGNDTIRTPNIDRLASEGVKLTQHIAAAPLCTPSRSAFITGRYALRSGMGSTGRVQVVLFLAGSGGLPPSETTFAKRLQQQGYTTGLVGKWHLGVNCEYRGDHCHHPNQHGFSYFYGLPFTLFNDFCLSPVFFVCVLSFQVCVRLCGLFEVSLWLLVPLFFLCILATAVWYVPFILLPTWNCIIMRNQEVIEQPMTVETLPQRLLGEAQNFIKRNADHPFLLFFSLAHIHTPMFKTPAFAGKSRHGRYGDNLEEVDWIIGKITETVDSLGLASNTLMYFASDHGGHLEDSDLQTGQKGGWNGIYKGGKAMGGWEGGIRVPGIFRWPGRLAAGKVVDEPTSLMDLYPTLKYLAKDTQPDRQLDGYNLMPLLEGKAARSEHEFMFHYCGIYLNAVRWHPPGDSIFKVHFFTPNFSPPGAVGCYDTKVCLCHGEHVTHHTPPLVYDLFHDPSESRPLTPDTEPRFAEILEQTMTWSKILWRPWLQPCCGTFPFCGCKEDTAQL
uniref:Arylsulfatase H n=1 Tax=Acanthochromis polyacanthus TaxID=80966 RepID=A0A3Q1G1X7_9TELE